ncbi:hypothetical protein EGH24_03925 [Halonotius terrestris]|uniref:Uncharacterized protein n=1 Tax=Halonotius terrestris TaxID=2487750 RepID=A0A8J8P845_9EURY|nr:hypothetical protein [Halonotius terrestris]TQQ82610.1 hypothetical protein EGH24_03925 [Halonotius terrestris]
MKERIAHIYTEGPNRYKPIQKPLHGGTIGRFLTVVRAVNSLPNPTGFHTVKDSETDFHAGPKGKL